MIQNKNEKLFNAHENRIKDLENEVVSLKSEINSMQAKAFDRLCNEIQDHIIRTSHLIIYRLAKEKDENDSLYVKKCMLYFCFI